MKPNIVVGKRIQKLKLSSIFIYLLAIFLMSLGSYVAWMEPFFSQTKTSALLSFGSLFLIILLAFSSQPVGYKEFWEIRDDEIHVCSVGPPIIRIDLKEQNLISANNIIHSFGTNSIFEGLEYNIDAIKGDLDKYISKIEIANIDKIQIVWKALFGVNGRVSFPIYLVVQLNDGSYTYFSLLISNYRKEAIAALNILENDYGIEIIAEDNILEVLKSDKDVYEYLQDLNVGRWRS